ncbi:acyl-ACP--UDP-N-acetylglucosamine O-acyltransferase [Verrucomicrobia bacterium LW23]|nr:acyl-ACP--UDP-N-acetylglucosamine O-acyltransferase [Verrucomicrobia bacterium LW23]
MTSLIHPYACVHPSAQLGANVRVGAGATIDEGCVIGDDCEIRANAVVTGASVLGAGNQIGYGAIIGAEPQDLSFKGGNSRVEIGARNVIREYVTIHRGTKPDTVTTLGDDCYLMAGAHVAHNCRVGNRVIIVNNVLLAGYVEVGDRAFLGGAAVVHQFVRVGEGAIMRGKAGIGKDLPPWFMAVGTNYTSGLNRVGMRRTGIATATIRKVQRVYQMLYEDGLNVTQALLKMEADPEMCDVPEIRTIIAFIRASKRGILRGGPAAAGRGDRGGSED